MKRTIFYISAILTLIACVSILQVYAQVDLGQADTGNLQDSGIFRGFFGGDFLSSIQEIGFSILNKAKLILNGIALIALAYVATLFILSFGDDGKVSEGKKKLIYVLIALVIINVPEVLYQILTGTLIEAPSDYNSGFRKVGQGATLSDRDPVGGGTFSEINASQCNLLFCPGEFMSRSGFVYYFLKFVEVVMLVTAVIFLTYGGFRLMFAAGDEEQKKAQRRRFVYGLVALLVVGFIQVIYQGIFFGGAPGASDVSVLVDLANLLLLFTGPIAIVFLIIGAYLLIVSGGSEDKVKRAKTILVNTFLAVILLLLSYTFLIEISQLQI